MEQPGDRSWLRRLRGDVDDDTYNDLVQTVLDDLTRLQGSIEETFAKRDVPTLKRLAHELKGVAMLFGDDALTESCEELMESDAPDTRSLEGSVRILLGLCDEAAETIEAGHAA